MPANSSLSILMPSRSKTSKFPDEPQFDRSETAAILEQNTRAVIDAINSRNYTDAAPLVAKHSRSDMDGIAKGTSSHSEDVAVFRQYAAMHPDYHIEIVNVAADVDEKTGYAIVYCLFNVTGQPLNIKRQSVSVVEWMRRDGKWQFYNTTSLRGLDGTGLPGEAGELSNKTHVQCQ